MAAQVDARTARLQGIAAMRLRASAAVIQGQQLIEAAEAGDVNRVRLLLDDGADIHYNNDRALRVAVSRKKLDVVKLLLERGANVTVGGGEVFATIARQGDEATATVLLDHGININQKWLGVAINFKKDGFVRFLIEKGINLNVSGLLNSAIQVGYQPTIDLLINNGVVADDDLGELRNWMREEEKKLVEAASRLAAEQKDLRNRAREIERQNEIKRQAAVQELLRRNKEENKPVNNANRKQVLRWCVTEDTLGGDELTDKDIEEKTMVMFFFNEKQDKQAECYLVEELKSAWGPDIPRIYQTLTNPRNGQPMNGPEVYRLPWSNKLIPQEIRDLIFLKGERMFNLKEKQDIKTRYGASTDTLYSGIVCPRLLSS